MTGRKEACVLITNNIINNNLAKCNGIGMEAQKEKKDAQTTVKLNYHHI